MAGRGLQPMSSLKDPRGKILDVLSVSLVAVGVVFWILPFQTLAAQVGFPAADALLRSLVFMFVASQLTTVGVAFYAYSLSLHKTTETEEQVESTLDRLESILKHERNGGGQGPLPRLGLEAVRANSQRSARLQIIVVVEALAFLLLYGWLVTEYRSNLYMQQWVTRNFPWAAYLLDTSVVFLLAGFFAAALFFSLGGFRREYRRRPRP